MNEAEWLTRRKRIDTKARCRFGIRLSCLVRKFRNRPNPRIVVIVDIPALEFIVFDSFDSPLIQYFRNVSSFDVEPPGWTPFTLSEVFESIWQNVDRDYHVRILAKRLLRIDKDMNAGLAVV
jgi:hypothetical protein